MPGGTKLGAAQVSLDEGGVRCVGRDRAVYVPFTEIQDVSVAPTIHGTSALVLATAAGEVSMRPAGPVVSMHGAIAQRLAELRPRSTPRPLPADFARAGRGLEEWLSSVAGSALGGRAYRDVLVDLLALAGIAADEHEEIEARAVCTHVLLSSRDTEALRAVARVLVMHALPPLVLAAARLAPGGAMLIDDDIVREIAPFLADADRAVLEAQLAQDPLASDGELLAALKAAKQEAIALARRRADVSHPQETKWRRLQSHGPGALEAGRWVGRTWAL